MHSVHSLRRPDGLQILTDPRIYAERVAAGKTTELLTLASAQGLEGVVVGAIPPGVDPQIDARRRELALHQEMLDAELRRVGVQLASVSVTMVVLKGSALSYAHYAKPWMRPSGDMDILIARDQRDAAAGALRAIGYARVGHIAGRWVMQQDGWVRDAHAGARFVVDVHFELTNRLFFASRLRAADVMSRAVPAPFAGDRALQLDAIDALIYSCVHRVVHHVADAKLVWTLDISRQASSLTAAECRELVTRARAIGLASVCDAAIREAALAWHASSGACADDVLQSLARAGIGERAAEFISPRRGQARDVWLDFQALSHWRDRMAMLRELVLPSREYVVQHAGAPVKFLPWVYARRLVVGLFRWMR